MLQNSRDLIARLEKNGFRLVSVNGSHHKFRHPQTMRTVIVPHPKRNMPIGTVRAIYKQAGWQKD